MSSTPNRSDSGRNGRRGLRRWWWLPAVAGLILVGGAIASLSGGGGSEASSQRAPIFRVKRGPLTISVATSGNISSADPILIRNEAEDRRAILSIVPEGSRVEKGDVLAQLDTATLEDEILQEESEVDTSKAEMINAEQALELAKRQGDFNIEQAKVDLRLAKLDLRKYAGKSPGEISPDRTLMARVEDLKERFQSKDFDSVRDRQETYEREFQKILDAYEGEFKQQLQEALNNIRIAHAEMKRAEETYEGSKKLHEKNYITENELEADQLDYQRKQSNLQLKRGEMRVLQQFTYQRRMAELQSAVEQARFALEKARHEAESNVIDARATLNSRRERHMRDKEHLKELKADLAACTIKAPRDGMIVYGTSNDDRRQDQEPLAEGVEVRERQVLFRMPASGGLIADVDIHESMLEKVEEGLPVRITTDALPDKTFTGKVEKIAVMPDSQSRWMNPDLRVYNTTLTIDTEGETKLRPGMSCNAEILVERFEDALHLPIQCVQRISSQPMVFVPTDDGPEAKPVEIGLDNNKMVRITGGVEEGEAVLLSPPLASSQRGDAQEERERRPGRAQRGADGEGNRGGEDARRGGGGRGGDGGGP